MATQTDPGRRSESNGPAGGAGTDTRAGAQQAASQAQEKAQAAAGQAQDKVREQLDQRSSQLGEQAKQQASDLRSVSEALRDQGKDRPAQAVDRLAGYAEQAGRYLRDRDADSMLHDAEDFGRRKPGAVAAGALVLGLAASRFLKASSSRRYSAQQTERHAQAPGHELGAVTNALPAPSTQPPASRAGF
jgi:hypothetical protein